MKLRKYWTVPVLLALLATALVAGDVNGKWKAEFPASESEKIPITLTFKADGENLTGSISGPRGEHAISEGKIQGDDLTFILNVEVDGDTLKLNYTGKLNGDEIQFKVDGPDQSWEFTATRAS